MENRFDALAKSLADSVSRREALRRLGGGLAGMLLASLGLGKAEGAPAPESACEKFCRECGIPPGGGNAFGVCVSSCEACLHSSGSLPSGCPTTPGGPVVCIGNGCGVATCGRHPGVTFGCNGSESCYCSPTAEGGTACVEFSGQCVECNSNAECAAAGFPETICVPVTNCCDKRTVNACAYACGSAPTLTQARVAEGARGYGR